MDDVRQCQTINRAQSHLLIRLTGAYRTTPVEALQVATATLPLHLQVKKLDAMYWIKKKNNEKVTRILHTPVDKQDVQEILTKAWQHLWQECPKARRLYGIIPDVEITGGLLHFLTDHGPFRQKLKDMNIVEDNLCHAFGSVATPEHVMLKCEETENLVGEQRTLLEDMEIAEALRTPELAIVLQEITQKVTEYYRKKFISGGDRGQARRRPDADQ